MAFEAWWWWGWCLSRSRMLIGVAVAILLPALIAPDHFSERYVILALVPLLLAVAAAGLL